VSSKQDLLLRLDSEFNDKGFKSAQDSARVLERELAKQEAAQRQLANLQMAAAKEQQRLDQVRLASMSKVGMGFTAVGLLAAAGLGMAAKAASDWESSWAGVTKTADGTQTEVAALEGQLRSLARSLPASHEEIAAVAEAAGQLGVKAKDIAGFTKTMIDLGVSTNLSAEDAATGLAQLGNVMGVLPSQADRAGAALVALGNEGASTEADILAMSLRIAGAGKTIGLSEAQVMGYANALTSMGIDAEAGGSAISRVMIDIAKSVDEGGATLDTFAQVAGMSTTTFAKKFRTDAAGAVAAFVEGLGRMQKSGKSTFGVLDDLGLSEIRVRDTLMRASNAGDLLTKSISLGSQAWEDNTALVNEANKRYETTASRVLIARNQLNDAAIDIGANVLPALAGAADRVGFLGEAFHGLPDGMKEAITILGGVVVTMGLVGGAALLLIPKLVAMNATLAASGPAGAAAARGLSAVGSAMIGPWGLALAGATVAMGIFAEKQYEAKQNAEQLAATLDQQTGAITAGTRVATARRLQDEGLLKVAQALGVALSDVTDSAVGQGPGMDRLAQAAKRANDEYVAMQEAFKAGKDVDYDELVGAEQRAQMFDRLTGKTRDMRNELAPLIDATKQSGEASKDATAKTEDFGAAQVKTAQDAERASKEIDDLIKSIEDYGDTVNGALDATSAYEAALDDASAALKENGKTANKARTELNLHTKAGRDNDKALRAIATSALKAATANFQNGKSVKSVTTDVVKARAEFVTMATKMGLSKTAAEKLANQLGLTKGNVSRLSDAITKTPVAHTTKMDVQTEAARAKLDGLQKAINQLTGKTVNIYTVEHISQLRAAGKTAQANASQTANQYATGSAYRTGKKPPGSAEGNLFEFANGGFAPIGNQRPQIRLAGGDGMTWAEQGAGPWEAFISGNPANAARSKALWWETGRRLGTVDNSQMGPTVVHVQPNIDRSLTVKAYGPSARDVLREAKKKQQQDEALNPIWGS
jgi:TP901 family phage tail tape measure protein